MSSEQEWKRGPVMPTEGMIDVGACNVGGGSTFNDDDRRNLARAIYRSMLAAAPQPPQDVRAPGESAVVGDLAMLVRQLAHKLRASPAPADDVAALRAELAARTAALEDERAIVNRIWKQLGSPSYEQLAGRSIHDLIDGLKDAAAGMSADVTRLTADRDRLAEAAESAIAIMRRAADDAAIRGDEALAASLIVEVRALRAALAATKQEAGNAD